MIDAEFWRYCGQRKLMFQSCAACLKARHPPTPFCARCQSTEVQWREAPSSARVFSYTTTHHATDESVGGATPYMVGVVEFEELGGVRLITNIIADSVDVRIGMRVRLVWDQVAPEMFLPLFTPEGPRKAPEPA
jgi:uncharacterized OB-fold protein